MLNEELRYNFGQLLAENRQMKRVVTKIILSVAKIDDRIIGNILDQEDESWSKLTNSEDCERLDGVQRINLFKKLELWFPDTIEGKPIGVSGDMEGWTFIAHEKHNLWNLRRTVRPVQE